MKFKVTPDFYFLLFAGLSLLLYFLSPTLVVSRYVWIGAIVIFIGISITTISNFTLLKNTTPVKPFETPTVLVTSGPFRLSRNPIYLGMTTILLGLAIYLGSLFSIIFSLAFAVIIDRKFIPLEERKLEELFGEKYQSYKKRVGRWL